MTMLERVARALAVSAVLALSGCDMMPSFRRVPVEVSPEPGLSVVTGRPKGPRAADERPDFEFTATVTNRSRVQLDWATLDCQAIGDHGVVVGDERKFIFGLEVGQTEQIQPWFLNTAGRLTSVSCRFREVRWNTQ